MDDVAGELDRVFRWMSVLAVVGILAIIGGLGWLIVWLIIR